MNVTPSSENRLPWARLWLPLLFQTALILVVPLQKLYTYQTGKLVILQTVPVDPYDLMRGYSQSLSYDISNLETLKNLPGGDSLKQREGKFYLVLESPTDSQQVPPLPWKAVRVSIDPPQNVDKFQVILKGEIKRSYLSTAVYGLETYYMPEDQRKKMNQMIQQVRRSRQNTFVVEVKIDQNGNSTLVGLWLQGQVFR